MGQQFKYDEKGSTFLYFILSVLVMVLIPVSYMFWPKGFKEEEKRLNGQRNLHGQSKWYKKNQKDLQRKKSKPSMRKILIIVGWIAFFFLLYKISNVEHDHVEYNPYQVLGLDESATIQQIKKRYRELSKEVHPDRGGDQEEFIKISKAYNSLSDSETKENWQKYGNPDGQQAMQFGIALPKWIFESNNSYIVLGLYFLVFMLVLPLTVRKWWYSSIKYSKEEVLLNTSQLFLYFLSKTTNMNLKRALMVFSAAFEFSHEHNSKCRAMTPNDNEELPELVRILETNFNINVNAKERPMNFPYSVKARLLIQCHLNKIDSLSQQLTEDLDYILSKSTILVQDMVNSIAQLTVMANYNKAPKPRLDSLENVMKLSSMFVQGLRETKSPLLQLPFFNDDYVKYCHTSKKHPGGVKNLRALAAMPENDRRQMLRRMGDEAYENMIQVLKNMPDVQLNTHIHVIDDDESHIITAGAIVTVTLHMTRETLAHLQLENTVSTAGTQQRDEDAEGGEGDQQQQPKLKPWEKQVKKKKKKKPVKGVKKPVKKDATAVKKADEEQQLVDEDAGMGEEGDDSQLEDNYDNENEEASQQDSSKQQRDDDDKEWEELQASFKKKEKAAFESIDKRTHTVFTPAFPVEKYEWWWVYMADRKNHSLLTAPVLICNLRDEQEVELKFPAPFKPGRYTYTVWCRSDSYADCDRCRDIKLDVQEAKPVAEDHPQWQISDDENDEDQSDSDEDGIIMSTDEEDNSNED